MSHFLKGLVEPLGIVGMGLSGSAALKLLKLLSPEKKVFTFDSKPGAAEWHDLEKMLLEKDIKTLIVSPGVPLSTPALVKAKNQGVRITSELALAASCLTQEKIIAVTGAVGKSTTVSLLAEATRAFDPNSLAVGNIGKPLAEYVCEVLVGTRTRALWLSLELSSFQLENFENLSAEYSVITFLTANHLERYKDLAQYYETKWSLMRKTKGLLFINSGSSDLLSFAMANKSPQLFFCATDDARFASLDLTNCQLLGAHNQQNLALVAAIIQTAGWPAASVAAIKAFPGLQHRLENLGHFRGIHFVNDSKATALDSVASAVESLIKEVAPPGTLYLLLGGKDKNLPWEWLTDFINFPNLKIIYFGEAAEKAQRRTGLTGPTFLNLGVALDHVFLKLKSGDTLLLSPGGTSHDEFKNFEERGDFFKTKVMDQFS